MGPQRFGCGMTYGGSDIDPGELVLQWGRSVSAAECLCKRDNPVAGIRASMGPQRFGCGMSASVGSTYSLANGFNGAAAFRLRNAEFRDTDLPSAGIGFNGAAAFRLRNAPPNAFRRRSYWRLQWGRSVSAAECTAPTCWFGS